MTKFEREYMMRLELDAKRLRERVEELERATPGPHIPPALLRRVEALGFVPGSGEPIGWLVAQVEELAAGAGPRRGAVAMLADARDAFARSGNGFISNFSSDMRWFAAVVQVRDRRHAAALLRWRGGGAK